MIQRIQTLYLLLAAGAFASPLAAPYLSATATDATIPLGDGRLTPTDNPGLAGLTIMSVVLALAAIFLFKNRPLQGRLATFGILLGVMTLVLAGFVAKTNMDAFTNGTTHQWGLGWAGPIIGTITSWLATRGIKADERLVRSMDRLR
jgi:Domain of unknown function (DUF4293)